MKGEWNGQGWYLQKDGTKTTFQSYEKISPNLDGKILQMEGLQISNGQIVNHALTTIAYDRSVDNCIFDVFVDPGVSSGDSTRVYHGSYPVVPNRSGFTWTQGQQRYTMKINGQGQWFEIGETSQDGKSWTQFFEQTLNKKF
jgi:hypothetical protein